MWGRIKACMHKPIVKSIAILCLVVLGIVAVWQNIEFRSASETKLNQIDEKIELIQQLAGDSLKTADLKEIYKFQMERVVASEVMQYERFGMMTLKAFMLCLFASLTCGLVIYIITSRNLIQDITDYNGDGKQNGTEATNAARIISAIVIGVFIVYAAVVI